MADENVAPNLAQVLSAAMSRLADPATDQAIVITAQGTHVGIAVAVKPISYKTWARALREIANEIENGPQQADQFFDETQIKKLLN